MALNERYKDIGVKGDATARVGDFAADAAAPILISEHVVCLPFIMTSVMVDDPASVAMLQKVMTGDRVIAVFPEIPPGEVRSYELDDTEFNMVEYKERAILNAGTLVRIIKILSFADGSARILVRGLRRILLKGVRGTQHDYELAVYTPMIQPEPDYRKVAAGMKLIMARFQDLSPYLQQMPEEVRMAIVAMPEPPRQIDLLIDSLAFSYLEKLAILGQPDLEKRVSLMLALMNREAEVAQLGLKIQNEVNQNLSLQQREFFLREQLRTIQNELREDSRTPDIIELENRFLLLDAPEPVLKTISKEIERMSMISPVSPEYHIAYTYVDWLLSLPWNVYTNTEVDIELAQKILDEDHFGLKDVKERILEFLAVLQMRNDGKAPILCLVGPPGVGKTSLGKSIARAMNRKFVRVALGGIHDEAEVRGHRRTYVGALPGRIIQNMKKVGSNDPVFMLDEIDKIHQSLKGDPASALLEVLDPAQNFAFNDNFIELDYDLSKVFFIATANMLETIPGPLLDRMEIIRLPGYTAVEKLHIAKDFLVKRQLQESGLTGKGVSFTVAGLNEIISYYTREGGVRELERVIGSVCRKIARRILSGNGEKKRYVVSAKMVHELLGSRKFLDDGVQLQPPVGSATGMAWTAYGGALLTIETTMMPGKGVLKLTGSLGNVMKESAEAAFSYIRSNAEQMGISKEVFTDNDFHIHVPDGATPKDGPSAGITITTALVSLLSGKPVRPYLSMTGEITLGGRVTAIGGLKEKSVAALRSGIKTVIMPKENAKDLEEIPDEVKAGLEYIMVDKVSTALPIIFGEEEK